MGRSPSRNESLSPEWRAAAAQDRAKTWRKHMVGAITVPRSWTHRRRRYRRARPGADGRDDFATAVRALQTRRRSLLLRRTGPSRQTYFQHFTGEEFFQHEFPHERSDLSHWRKRLGGLEGPMRLTETADRPRSDALKDVRASHPYHATIWADICRDPSRNNGRRADEASRPYRRYSAIRRPIPRCLEHYPRTLNAPHCIIGDCRTWTHWAAEENSGEISGSWIDRQNFQD